MFWLFSLKYVNWKKKGRTAHIPSALCTSLNTEGEEELKKKTNKKNCCCFKFSCHTSPRLRVTALTESPYPLANLFSLKDLR